MALPPPRPGLVFRYEYLWRRQAEADRLVAEKDRPACIVLQVASEPGARRVLIVPITSQAPLDGRTALRIPAAVLTHLDLDPSRPAWVILDEANIDTWPTPDMRPIPGKPGIFAYGFLPLKLTNALRAEILSAHAARRLGLTKRDTS